MIRRQFLQSLALTAGFALLPKAVPAESDEKKYYAFTVASGSSIGDNLQWAQKYAKASNSTVIFTFNYSDHFMVYPNGKWTCVREGGGKAC